MAQDKRIEAESGRPKASAGGGPAIGSDGVAAGLGAELGVPPRAAGGADPTRAGAKPAMLGVYDQPAGRRFGALGPLILVLVVIGILLLLAYALFAAHGGGGQAADAAEMLRVAATLPA